MRIIAGKFKGRKLRPPRNLDARPTTDMAREGLFNVLREKFPIENGAVLDLFFGSGAVALEFVSRGAGEVTAVDIRLTSKKFLETIAREWEIDNLKVVKADVFKLIARAKGRFDIVFADPPYDLDRLGDLPDLALASQWLEQGGVFILEHGAAHDFSDHPALILHKKFGHVHFSFFRNPQGEGAATDG